MPTGLKIELFSQANCAGCVQVKNLLNAKNLTYKELKIDDPLGANRQDLFIRLPGVRSVPQVFINDKYIGGVEELVKELSSNDYY